MSQNPLVDSGEKSSKKTGLKPSLAAALASLEVQLDQELARYRRTRSGYRTFSKPHVGISTSSKHQLTAIHPTRGKTEPPLEDSLQKFGLATPKASTPSVGQEELLVTPETKINTPKSVAETQDQVLASATAPDTLLQPQSNTSVSSKTQHLQSEQATPTDSAQGQTIPAPNASIVPTKVNEQTHSKTENVPESEDNTGKQPNDYLESSEALLRSLAEEEPKTHKSTNSNDSLLSPLGIGSMLLLLLASLTLGYVVFNPKSLSQFSFNGLFTQNAPTTAENTTDNTAQAGKNVKTVAQPTLSPIPKYPNLATDEFPEVRDPNDVVSLKPKSQPTPPALPNPVNVQSPNNRVTVPNVQPPVGLTSTQETTLNPPQTPSNTQQKPDTQIKPSADGFYHVITDNLDDRSFASARQIVPDAYLSADGKFIYLGALKSKEKAQELLQEIQAKGIQARIQ
ncbi:hypothetical protein SAMD00079811_22260 [Scytonema sp. HK-05]|uniref:hypothetical protein n=1 Tax=Scytonema sp. HK-05 TaxID=1137095 RepID=UPI000937D3A7|nr:hypothetical protein [Scytonema sp. HK-05]OKH49735.1 hypothetical protein NIES2130_34720 [Scytonema sp. HK-05]BAY44625.1 hypothetical protein SAMD00079811_22260 [Scytonema sp. HK-05]